MLILVSSSAFQYWDAEKASNRAVGGRKNRASRFPFSPNGSEGQGCNLRRMALESGRTILDLGGWLTARTDTLSNEPPLMRLKEGNLRPPGCPVDQTSAFSCTIQPLQRSAATELFAEWTVEVLATRAIPLATTPPRLSDAFSSPSIPPLLFFPEISKDH